MLLLPLDVLTNRRKVLLGKADRPIATLPDKAIPAKAAIHLVGACAFRLADLVGEADKALHLDGQVNVRVGASDRKIAQPLGFSTIVFDEGVGLGFDRPTEHRGAMLAVPVQVQVDGGVDMRGFCDGHG